MDPRLLALADAQRGPFRAAQAIELGTDRDELARLVRHRVLTRLRRGVYVESGRVPADPYERHRLELDALRLVVTSRAVVSHASAGVLHGLDLLDPDLAHLHVTRSDLGASRVEAGVRHHAAALPPEDVVELDGRWVTSLARTAVDIARHASVEQAVVAVDAALRAGADHDAVRSVLFTCASWNGARTAGRAVAFGDAGAESPGESLCRLVLARAGLPPVRTQVELRDRDGLAARVDLLFDEQRTVVEFDGRVKYGLEGDAADAADVLWREKRREDRVRALGYEVVRVVWADLARPQEVRRRVLAAFERARPRSRTAS